MNARLTHVINRLLLLLVLIGCDQPYETMVEARQDYAIEAEGPVIIALFDDLDRPDYARGVQLALEEINATQGGLLGRPLEIITYQDGDDFKELRPTIKGIAKDRRISAVFGHSRSDVAIPASIIYNASEVLFFSSYATDPMLTDHEFRFVFRTLSDDKTMSEEAAHLARLFGYKRIASLHGRDDYSRELAFLFEDAARRQGLEVAYRGSFFADDVNYRSIIGQLSGLDVDAVYVSTETEAGARLIRQLREMGLFQPVIVSSEAASGDLARGLGDYDDHVMAPMVYDPENRTARNTAFQAAWSAEYGGLPGRDAALGYDTMFLFAKIVTRARSTEPQVLAASAHYGPPVVGVSGFYAYNESGDVFGKTYGFRAMRAGRWYALPGVEMPYLLAGLEAALAADVVSTSTVASYESFSTADLDEDDPNAELEEEPPEMDEGLTSIGAEEESDEEAASNPNDITASLNRISGGLNRNQTWLALAQGVLGFERLGVVAMPTDRGASATSLARSVAAKRDFEIIICEVEPAGNDVSEEEAEALLGKRAKDCYSELAPQIDAMFVAPGAGISAELSRSLNRGLRSFQVPAVSIGDTLDEDYGLTLAITGSDLGLDDPERARRFEGLLKDIRIFDLSRSLGELPTIAVDFESLEAIGLRLTPIQLSVLSRALEHKPAMSVGE